VLFEVDDEGWDALDRKEGAPSAYHRVPVQVLSERGEAINAVTYAVREEEKEAFVAPHPHYIRIVRNGLRNWGMSDAQLNAVAMNEESECPDGFFFYGTLLRGEPRFRVLPKFGLDCVIMAEAFGRLLDLGSFPALVDTDSSRQLVQGDFVKLQKPEDAIRELDQIEGFNGFGKPNSLYRRSYIGIGVGDGRVRYGWTYCLADRATAVAEIVSGDWRQHRGNREAFLERLVYAHSDGDELGFARRIAERVYWRDQTIESLAKSLMPLRQALGRDEISERKMAQASGKWAVTL
jgi:gamma-glutamylcyclotransferase (GGCT)/AIG2-like uncharacterized protein YtfP